MTFLELILLLETRGEKVLTDGVSAIYTDKRLYSRVSSSVWEEKELPVMVESKDFLPLVIEPPKSKKTK